MILTILIRSQISNPSVCPRPAAAPGIKPNNNQLMLNMSLLRGRTSGHGHSDKYDDKCVPYTDKTKIFLFVEALQHDKVAQKTLL